ncbi:hypothetical protein [Helicobacter cinaedi]|nr:hypothetical protein [Helicobacter cinaedi]
MPFKLLESSLKSTRLDSIFFILPHIEVILSRNTSFLSHKNF